MKVYTLTTQYANNMGALLQCYALCKYLNSLNGVECKVLQYLPNGHKRSWTLFHKPHSFRDVLKLMYEFIRVDNQIVRYRKQKKIKQFIRDFIPLSDNKFKRKDIIVGYPEADAFVVGSDQIWNFKYRRDFTYFLDFVKDDSIKKVSYAASIADDWGNEDIEIIKPIISEFDEVSIREEGNLMCVNSALEGKEATVVCDPVFLLNRKQWDEIKTATPINEPYIFCYFLGVSSIAVEAVERIRSLTGYKVVHLNLNSLDKFNSDILIKNADPKDFIGLIANASYVCTNSFHCSAFSIIYRKNFKFIPKHMANERVVQLESIFGINVIMTREKLLQLKDSGLSTDYSNVKNGEKFIEYSKGFLKRALNA